MPLLLVRSTADGPLVFTDEGPPKVQLEWAARNDPGGFDVQEVPAHLADNINFRRAVNKGLLEVVEADEEIKAKLSGQGQHWRERQAQQAAEARASLSPESDNDLVTLPCIGPSTKGMGQCGEAVVVRERTKSDHPPLCNTHKDLAHQFVPTETDEMVDGRSVKKWVRAGMADRVRQNV